METLLVVRELADGSCCVYPLADPEAASFGLEEAAIDEQRLFLAELLATATPEMVARFAFPHATHLVETDVLIPRHDLPRRLRVREKLRIPSAVIPLGRDVWVNVLPLHHMFHLKAGDDLEAAIRSEVERLCRARELTPQEYLDLLPAERHGLVRVALTLDRETGAVGRSANKELAERRKKKEATEVLESVARSLHADDRVYGEAPIVGRDRELREMASLLEGKTRRSVLLLGAELSGKTALFHEWLRAERKAKRERLVFASSGAGLIAGMSGLGQWQERVRRVMLAAETLDAILYFENLADLFSDLAEGLVDMPSAMRSFLDEGRVRVVGELTPPSLDLAKNRFAGFLGAFSTVRLEPLTAPVTLRALETQVAHHRAHDADNPTLDDEALPTLLELVDRYKPETAYPGKAMRLLDTVRRSRQGAARERLSLSSRDVFEAFSLESGIPLFLLREDLPLKTEEVTKFFRARIVGQADAIRSVVEVITLVKANLQPAGKPLAAFLFIGPTGVGKTELAKCLAAFLFGSPDRLVRFDMSEYQDPFAAERLIRGADRVEGVLTRKVRQQPFSVLLLDEIEKAHPAVLDLLLQVLGEARLTDARGKTAHFHNTILIMTSNLGASHRNTAIGMGAARLPDQTFYEKEIAKTFRPELVNRIDRVVTFHPLSLDEAGRVGALAVSHVCARRGFGETGVTLELTGDTLSALAAAGYSDRYGARALRREVEDRLVAPVARLLSRLGPAARGGTVEVSTRGPDGLRLALAPGAPPGRREIRGIADLSARRRSVDRWFRFSAVEDVREQIQFLVMQLSYGARPKKRHARPAGEIARLQAEHHRFTAVYERARSARDDVHAIEEVALTALLEGEASVTWNDELKEAYETFRRALLHLLVVREKGRDHVTLLAQELNGATFDRWLVPLLSQRKAREWTFTFHIHGDGRSEEDDWPTLEERRFGPPRNAEEMERRLREPRRRFHTVLIRVEGPYALLLALEAGLHRFPGETPAAKPTHLYVSRLAQRATFEKKDWKHEALNPVAVAELTTLSRAAAHREYDPVRKELHLLDKSRTLPLAWEGYWHAFEEIALEHLLCLEEDGDIDEAALEAVFTGPLDSSPASTAP